METGSCQYRDASQCRSKQVICWAQTVNRGATEAPFNLLQPCSTSRCCRVPLTSNSTEHPVLGQCSQGLNGAPAHRFYRFIPADQDCHSSPTILLSIGSDDISVCAIFSFVAAATSESQKLHASYVSLSFERQHQYRMAWKDQQH